MRFLRIFAAKNVLFPSAVKIRISGTFVVQPVNLLRLVYGFVHEARLKKPNEKASNIFQTALSLNVCNGFTASKCKIANVYRPPYGFTGPSRGTHMQVQMARLEILAGNEAGRTAHPRSGLQGRTNKVPGQKVNRSSWEPLQIHVSPLLIGGIYTLTPRAVARIRSRRSNEADSQTCSSGQPAPLGPWTSAGKLRSNLSESHPL